MNQATLITKSSGLRAAFDEAKLKESLLRSGAQPEVADAIVRQIAGQVYEGMSTKQIFRRAYNMLRKKSRPHAGRYSLKQALKDLGPTGFPFERLMAQLLSTDGYQIMHSVWMAGACIRHEVDVLAVNRHKVMVCECKFHNSNSLDSDVKVPLYIHSRFRDLEAGALQQDDYAGKQHECWIFTNTRFTDDALNYGRCAQLHLVGWNTPPGDSLREWIDRQGLHPLTCLSTLTRYEQKLLLEENVVLAKEILAFPGLLEKVHVSAERRAKVLQEAQQICEGS